ncbi:MAG: hypothetical protein GY757_10090 [bacterium]|nr:hypothetical protein [bacterium]
MKIIIPIIFIIVGLALFIRNWVKETRGAERERSEILDSIEKKAKKYVRDVDDLSKKWKDGE